MRRIATRRWLVALALAAVSASAHAHDGHPAAAPSAVASNLAWDFTLPTLDGARFVKASSFTGPVLVNFWGRDCAPCIAELPRLEAFAKANPHWTVLLVSTDAPADARQFVQRHDLHLTVLRPGANMAALMRGAGNRSGGLPFTVALRDARICDQQAGELDAADLQRLTAACEEARKR